MGAKAMKIKPVIQRKQWTDQEEEKLLEIVETTDIPFHQLMASAAQLLGRTVKSCEVRFYRIKREQKHVDGALHTEAEPSEHVEGYGYSIADKLGEQLSGLRDLIIASTLEHPAKEEVPAPIVIDVTPKTSAVVSVPTLVSIPTSAAPEAKAAPGFPDMIRKMRHALRTLETLYDEKDQGLLEEIEKLKAHNERLRNENAKLVNELTETKANYEDVRHLVRQMVKIAETVE